MITTRISKHHVTTAAILCLASAGLAMAQVKTETTEKKGAASVQTTVERGEVVYLAGNELVVKMENGDVRHFTVPASATATVGGKPVALKDLKPGMKLERTITTTTTPKTVTTVRTGTGEVVMATPPSYVTVRFEDGTVERFKIPTGTKFTIDGQEKTASDLKPGMKISATRVTESSVVDVSGEKSVTGTVATPAQQGALLIAAAQPAAAGGGAAAGAPATAAPKGSARAGAPASASEPPAKTLPKTGSAVPMIGLLGLLLSGASFGVRLLRTSRGR